MKTMSFYADMQGYWRPRAKYRKMIPAIRACHLTDAQKRAFVLADNRLSELATWNKASLKRELKFLSELEIDYDFSAIGFETADIDFILSDGDEADDPADALPQTLNAPAISRLGNLWLLGQHRVYCGSALEGTSYQRLLGNGPRAHGLCGPALQCCDPGHAGGRGSPNIVNLRWLRVK